jgi:hypothetical protein
MVMRREEGHHIFITDNEFQRTFMKMDFVNLSRQYCKYASKD